MYCVNYIIEKKIRLKRVTNDRAVPIKAEWQDGSLAVWDFIHLSTTKTTYLSRFVFAKSAFATIEIS